MEEAAGCAVCFELFKEEEGRLPRLLHCGHSFCENCLAKLNEKKQGGGVECPKCRQITPLPQGGVKSFPRNFDLLDLLRNSSTHKPKEIKQTCQACDEKRNATIYCLNCKAYLCVACNSENHATSFLQKHERVDVAQAPAAKASCPKHPTSLLEFWCTQDNTAVCTSCYIAGAHQGHKVQTLEDAWERVKTDAERAMADVERAIAAIDEAKKEAKNAIAEERESAKAAQQAVSQFFSRLVEALQAREEQVQKQLQDWLCQQEAEEVLSMEQLDVAREELQSAGMEAQTLTTTKNTWMSDPHHWRPKGDSEKQSITEILKDGLTVQKKTQVKFLDKNEKQTELLKLIPSVGILEFETTSVALCNQTEK